MKLSTRARYGTRALLDLALHSGDNPVQLKDIARRQDVSLHYLEHIISPLVGAGIVTSLRGVGGGLRLARRPQEIKLSEVVELLEGTLTPVQCLGSPEVCDRVESCVTREVWDELGQAMNAYLSSITLKDLVDRHRAKEGRGKAMYHI